MSHNTGMLDNIDCRNVLAKWCRKEKRSISLSSLVPNFHTFNCIFVSKGFKEILQKLPLLMKASITVQDLNSPGKLSLRPRPYQPWNSYVHCTIFAAHHTHRQAPWLPDCYCMTHSHICKSLAPRTRSEQAIIRSRWSYIFFVNAGANPASFWKKLCTTTRV